MIDVFCLGGEFLRQHSNGLNPFEPEKHVDEFSQKPFVEVDGEEVTSSEGSAEGLEEEQEREQKGGRAVDPSVSEQPSVSEPEEFDEDLVNSWFDSKYYEHYENQ